MDTRGSWLQSDAFLAVVADSITCFPLLQDKLNEIYANNKFRYYESARSSSSYSELITLRGKLAYEVASKRNFGILLAARDDEKVYEEIRPSLLTVHPALKGYIKSPQKNVSYERTVFDSIGNARLGIQKSISLLMMSAYLISKECGNRAITYPICEAAIKYGEIYIDINSAWSSLSNDASPTISTMLSMYRFSQEDWRYIKNFLRADYITLLRESYRRGEPLSSYTTNVTENFEDYADTSERENTIVTAWALTSVMSKAGIDWESICGDYILTKDEQTDILRACLDMSLLSGRFRPHHYLAAYIVFLLCKEIVSIKKFYWSNNAETQYNETQHLSRENAILRDRAFQLEQKIADIELRLVKESEEHAKQNQRDFYNETKPLRDDIASLEKRICELESQLLDCKSNMEELELLRSLVLSTGDTQTSTPNSSIHQLLSEKKVIFFGGSLNMRKKITQKFPEMIVMDGTETIMDLRILDNADVVIIYTYNMSHSLYERTITYIKQNRIPYAFLERSTNTALLENQINRIISGVL